MPTRFWASPSAANRSPVTKRAFDLALSAAGLAASAPAIAAVAIAIRLDSRGPVFYRGWRSGRHGLPFRIFKFRTMVTDAESRGTASTSDEDSRITRVGHVVRKLKLDELPQLINVLLGDMSFVGPRPQFPNWVERYKDEEKAVLELRPGITDWASIKFHNEGEILAQSGIADADEAYAQLIHPAKMRLQLRYLEQRNMLVDLGIIASTVATLVSTRLGGEPVGLPRDQ